MKKPNILNKQGKRKGGRQAKVKTKNGSPKQVKKHSTRTLKPEQWLSRGRRDNGYYPLKGQPKTTNKNCY